MKAMMPKFYVVLARPEHPANIGLVARSMKNTGFESLRLVGVPRVEAESKKTAVHSRDILESAEIFDSLEESTADLEAVFAATSKKRKNYTRLSLDEAVERMFHFSDSTRVGLLFGNERTGLTSEELRYSNFRYEIPQATQQPSYNVASAVLITLFRIFTRSPVFSGGGQREKPLPTKDQVECIEMILAKLERKGFIHKTNKKHMTEMIFDLFGRLDITEKDRKLLYALFAKGVDD